MIDGWWMDGESLVQMRESCVARTGHLEEGRKKSPSQSPVQP